MNTDLTFAADYTAEVLREIPTSGAPRFYYPALGTGGRDGVLVSVSQSNGNHWLGQFAFGHTTHQSALIASPQNGHLIVVSEGAGYEVNVRTPQDWRTLGVDPVRQIVVVHEAELVLLADWIRIAAFGTKGQVWRTEQLCWDELHIERVEQGRVFGSGSDPTDSHRPTKQFVLNLADGTLHSTEFDSKPWTVSR